MEGRANKNEQNQPEMKASAGALGSTCDDLFKLIWNINECGIHVKCAIIPAITA
jgi:hypothetical protein